MTQTPDTHLGMIDKYPGAAGRAAANAQLAAPDPVAFARFVGGPADGTVRELIGTPSVLDLRVTGEHYAVRYTLTISTPEENVYSFSGPVPLPLD